MEKKMKRDANPHDMPITMYSSLPRVFMRRLREKDEKNSKFDIVEVRLGKIMLYFAGSDIAAFAYIYPKEKNNERSELIYEQYAKASDRGRETAAYLEKNEVVFNGGKFQYVNSGKEYHASLHRVLATESTDFIETRVARILNAGQEEKG